MTLSVPGNKLRPATVREHPARNRLVRSSLKPFKNVCGPIAHTTYTKERNHPSHSKGIARPIGTDQPILLVRTQKQPQPQQTSRLVNNITVVQMAATA